MFSILPFEVPFYEQKHHFPIHYVGNPTAEEVRTFLAGYHEPKDAFCQRNNLDPSKPIIALLAGSRKQEIKDNLPAMIRVARSMNGNYQYVLACAPSIDDAFYEKVAFSPALSRKDVSVNAGADIHAVHDATYPLLAHATAALVTSGTATLETALFNVPQVVCYKTPVPKIIRWGFNHIIQCKYISLVNLIADEEVVPELFADRFSVDNIRKHLLAILPGQARREKMLEGYRVVCDRLGTESAPENAAKIICEKIHSV